MVTVYAEPSLTSLSICESTVLSADGVQGNEDTPLSADELGTKRRVGAHGRSSAPKRRRVWLHARRVADEGREGR
jgi:hypothetical protein